MGHPHLVSPETKVNLDKYSTRGKEFHDDREKAERELLEYRLELAELQRKLYAEGAQSLLVILQGMDTSGKDGTTRHVFRGVNPQGVEVSSFKQPTHLELAHDFLWRIHLQAPARGMIGVFNRSQYEDVLIVRVDSLVPEHVWKERYDLINNFEALLVHNRTRVLKFYLHISPQEQLERFQARLDDSTKHWKFEAGDLEHRKKWEQYQSAYEDVLSRCSTPHAPWYVIPADQKWYRNWIVARTIVEALREMDPQYPPVDWKPGDFELEP